MEKQTAVEWLFNWMENNQYFIGNDLLKTIEQAKEMEKQQHGQTWDSALKAGEDRAWNVMRAYSDFDDYYEKTYKNK
jgi:hypothetical protein